VAVTPGLVEVTASAGGDERTRDGDPVVVNGDGSLAGDSALFAGGDARWELRR
jgi:hypothetical protein